MKSQTKIAITGPESSGKSILSDFLGSYFNAIIVKEYSRTYYLSYVFTNSREEIIAIAEGQIQAEREAAKSDATLIICDSDLINIKIWMEYYDFEVPQFILDYLDSNPYDFSLLLLPNTPWIADPLRRNPDDRMELYESFKTNLLAHNYSFEIVKELHEARHQEAVQLIKNRFSI